MSSWNTSHEPAGKRDGFTLLEIMLAVTILAVVSTVVYNTWNTAWIGWKRGTDVMDTFQRQRIVLETLSELAKSAVFYGSKPELYAVKGAHSTTEGDSVSFVTASDVLLPPGEGLVAGMRRVTLSLNRDRDGNLFLGIVNAPALEDPESTEPGIVHVLSADVVGFTVRYLDPRNGTWADSWEGQAATPSGFEFTVVFREGPAGTPAVTVTRQVEVPSAQHALEHGGGGLPPGLPVPPVGKEGQP